MIKVAGPPELTPHGSHPLRPVLCVPTRAEIRSWWSEPWWRLRATSRSGGASGPLHEQRQRHSPHTTKSSGMSSRSRGKTWPALSRKGSRGPAGEATGFPSPAKSHKASLRPGALGLAP